MKTTFSLAKTEIQKLFYSPVPWLVLIIFTLQVGFVSTDIFSKLFRYVSLGYTKDNSITYSIFSDYRQGAEGIFVSLASYLFLYVPLITMGIMSKDLSTGTIKQLYSSPITNLQIILGKYLALIVFSLTLCAIVGVFCLYGAYSIEQVDSGVLLSGMLGVYLLLSTYCAIGLFMSSLTSYSVVAAVLTLAFLFLLNSVGKFGLEYEFVRDVTYWLSIENKSIYFYFGLIASKNVLYFVLVTCMFLGFTYIKLSSDRVQSSSMMNAFKYTAVFLTASIVGIISSIPKMQKVLDTTRSKTNTLSVESQKVMANLKEKVTIRTYTNAFGSGRHVNLATPKLINFDLDRLFIYYVRYRPETSMKYEYYYQNVENSETDKRFPFMNDGEKLEKLREIYDWNFNIVPYEELKHPVDLSGEEFKFVRVLETESGKRSFLRVFDDPFVVPFEPEVTAAFKQLVMDLPTVGFVSGHGERDSKNLFDRGYNKIAEEKSFRYSFINQGFNFADITLRNPVPDSISVIVLSEPKSAYTPEEISNLKQYINRGGNLLICGEPNRTEVLNPIIASLGVEFLKGTLVKDSEKYDPSLTVTKPTSASKSFSYILEEQLKNPGQSYTFPTAGALKVNRDKGFTVTSLVTSDSTESWIELQTTNFVDETPEFDPTTEVKQPHEMVVALNRMVNNKEQRIIVASDADWISNSEIVIQRKDLRSYNYNLIKACFFWLSNGEAPIDTRRPTALDTKFKVSKAQLGLHGNLLKLVLPGVLIAITALLLMRRKNR